MNFSLKTFKLSPNWAYKNMIHFVQLVSNGAILFLFDVSVKEK